MTFRMLVLAGLLCGAAAAQGTPTPKPLPQPQAPATVTATRSEPTPQEFTADKLARLKVPAGFTIKVVATGLGNARMLHVMPDGGIYLTRRGQNDVWYLKDVNKDGKIEAVERRQVAQNLTSAHGIAVRNGKLYIAGASTIWVMDIAKDGSLSRPRVFADRLPEPGQHSARTIAWGPDGYLYASFGSQNNDAPTPNPEVAALLRIAPDGKSREVYASGLRHTIGFGWQPVTGALYGFDQGSDWHGDNIPPEELNVIQRGKNYGWPFCYGDKVVDPYVNSRAPGNITNAEYCAGTQGSVLTYTAHAAAIAGTFYTASQFPAMYRGDMFAAMRGSWNRSEPSGYEIVRADFDEAGQPQSVTPFVTGFVYEENGEWKQFGRVAGVATYTDGSLLFTDDQSGVLYRVLYTGGN
ncbi:PQQ-dependent sugar dehydrogenase [Deinococcus arboris]|nr:sorbosone dehydrogenase family protein [Deinococcus arboris]